MIENVQALIKDVLGPVTDQVIPELVKSKTGLQGIYDSMRELKADLNNDYEIRRKRPKSPLPTTNPDTSTATTRKIISGDSVTKK